MTAEGISCCDMPMSKVPARQEDQVLGVECLLYCCNCGHYEPWDVNDDDPTVAGTDGSQLREDRS